MSGRIGSRESIVAGGEGALVSYDLAKPSAYKAFDPVGPHGNDSDYPAIGCAVPNAYMAGFVGKNLEGALESWIGFGRRNFRTRGMLNVEMSRASLVKAAMLKSDHIEYLCGAQGVLDLPNGAERYLEGLTPNQRRRVSKELRIFETAGCKIRAVEVTEFSEDLAQLQLDTYAKHGFTGGSVEHVMRSHYKAIEDLGDSYRMLLATAVDGSPIGFLSFIQGTSSAQPRHLGLVQNTTTRNARLYFNLAFYSLIRNLRGTNVRSINYGPEALLAKQLRGCRIEPMVNFISTENRLIHEYWAKRDSAVRAELTELAVL
ncbi:peptidogalycan biosysnthesis protein [Paenarthrobacter nitroguajacolicus]|uniref:peptidogalycan biosysnthesis protein n=1 Tax=Paenarthrobacter nitroguajacolicus TaxID=211146 RepID=UPI0015B8A86E|nr:peptidogalycan biosysnthesis protein [Paenarthrobacter nitroguajacolicus]NWL34717.1 hypothetical protein [Paenarthrobacter nitroguajacolicus]